MNINNYIETYISKTKKEDWDQLTLDQKMLILVPLFFVLNEFRIKTKSSCKQINAAGYKISYSSLSSGMKKYEKTASVWAPVMDGIRRDIQAQLMGVHAFAALPVASTVQSSMGASTWTPSPAVPASPAFHPREEKREDNTKGALAPSYAERHIKEEVKPAPVRQNLGTNPSFQAPTGLASNASLPPPPAKTWIRQTPHKFGRYFIERDRPYEETENPDRSSYFELAPNRTFPPFDWVFEAFILQDGKFIESKYKKMPNSNEMATGMILRNGDLFPVMNGFKGMNTAVRTKLADGKLTSWKAYFEFETYSPLKNNPKIIALEDAENERAERQIQQFGHALISTVEERARHALGGSHA